MTTILLFRLPKLALGFASNADFIAIKNTLKLVNFGKKRKIIHLLSWNKVNN